jgi:putative sigma-54 modulation protein
MRLDIACPRKLWSSDLSAYVHRSLNFAIDRFADRVQKVRVRIADLNGSKGGVDKQVRLIATVKNIGSIVVEGVSNDAYSACDIVAQKLKKVVARAKQKRAH